ncbi:hypothetical protein JZ751_014473, partial [Albula glossodonta]
MSDCDVILPVAHSVRFVRAPYIRRYIASRPRSWSQRARPPVVLSHFPGTAQLLDRKTPLHTARDRSSPGTSCGRGVGGRPRLLVGNGRVLLRQRWLQNGCGHSPSVLAQLLHAIQPGEAERKEVKLPARRPSNTGLVTLLSAMLGYMRLCMAGPAWTLHWTGGDGPNHCPPEPELHPERLPAVPAGGVRLYWLEVQGCTGWRCEAVPAGGVKLYRLEVQGRTGWRCEAVPAGGARPYRLEVRGHTGW